MSQHTLTCDCRSRGGFSLLELVIVIMVLGIAGGMAVPLFSQALNHTKVDAAAEAVAGALQFAQLRALNSQQEMRVSFDPGIERLRVEMNANTKLSHLQNPSKDVISAADVDTSNSWKDVPHPLESAGGSRSYTIRFSDEPAYRGVDLFSASFNGASAIRFLPTGLPDAGGTVVLRFGGLQRTVTVKATTGAVSIS